MLKFIYIIYGGVVVVVSTLTNLNYVGQSTTTSSNWNSHGTGSSYGGSGGSTGGFSSGGGHK